jgi:hypothetical protein
LLLLIGEAAFNLAVIIEPLLDRTVTGSLAIYL